MASKLPIDDDRTLARGHPEVPTSADAGGPPSRGAPLPAGAHLRHFEIIDHLGEGGFGIVYLARDTRLERQVAIKEYMPSSLAWRMNDAQISVLSERDRETFELGLNSFRNEARMLAHFDHPSLVKVYDYWDANGTAYMAMPFYRGTTLKQFLKELREPPREDWLRHLLQTIGGALQEMHGEDCLHRDVAPDNILIRENGVPLLLDFGAARRVISDKTHNLTVILKSGYAPVEQYAEASSAEQGPWTDIYALAAVAYFAITGKVPAPSVSRMIKDELPPLGTIAAGSYSAGFLHALDRALAVRRENRPQSIAEFVAALGPVESSQHTSNANAATMSPAAVDRRDPELGEPHSTVTALPQKRRPVRAPVLLAGGAVLTVAAVIITVANWPSKLEPRPEQEPTPRASAAPIAAPAAVSEAVRPPSAPAENAATTPSKSADSPSVIHSTAPRAARERSAPPEAATSVPPVARAPNGSRINAAEAARRPPAQRATPRCADVLSRLQLGEPISSEEQALFEKECRR